MVLLITPTGIVPGGGTALLWASRQLDGVKAKCINMDQKVAWLNNSFVVLLLLLLLLL